MKLAFEANLDYQLDAIEAVCDLFRGQEICRTEFTVTRQSANTQTAFGFDQTDFGIGNRLELADDQLLQNLVRVQLRNGLQPSSALKSGDFTVEMETGTGKTYVYLRTIFELNRRFGFTKFVIVVPSIAIKEGVHHFIATASSHFKTLYAGVSFDHFIYDSTRLGQVRNFATSPNIQIMLMTVGAINKKDVNNLYKDSEQTGGEKPIDLIKSTRPIVIVDEPQSVDGGITGAGMMALTAMDSLCTLRYSATHVHKHHMVYKLDAVDAYERRLVKQIEVASATVEDAFNRPFVRLEAVQNKRGEISARVEVDVRTSHGVSRKLLNVYDGDDLEQLTQRNLYANLRIGEIRTEKENEFLELRFGGGEIFLRPGESWGGIPALQVQREMIRRTIREHFEKELRLRKHGIKVLSLFFIDAVSKYRQYGADGAVKKGEYALIFEDEYRRASRLPEFADLFTGVNADEIAELVHDGYFSIDKRGTWIDTDESTQNSRDSAERAYSLIMKEKEKLLSFDTSLKFIFSHSALREGWDNPNIFQICTLREMNTERGRRQTIGRGLRLCVNQDGQRIHGFEFNTLTVIAPESYQEFAKHLQKEIEEDIGTRFGVVETSLFATLTKIDENGGLLSLGIPRAEILLADLISNGYLSSGGEVQEPLRLALRKEAKFLPPTFADFAQEITYLLRRMTGRFEIRNADERTKVRTRKSVLRSAEFKALWERIKFKTTYQVHFDNEALINICTAALRDAPPIPKTRLQWRRAGIAISKSGVEANEREGAATTVLNEGDILLPDILTELQDRTQLTRRSLQRILSESDRLADFPKNPQLFIDLAADAINRCKALVLVDGIKYYSVGPDDYYAQELFEKEELVGYVRSLVPAQKSVYEQVLYESVNEERFARQLENTSAVRLYTKLPHWFRIPTPLGTYNPDWAILLKDGSREAVYFVVETKGSTDLEDLRASELAQIKCGAAHFSALRVREPAAKYVIAHTLEDVMLHT